MAMRQVRCQVCRKKRRMAEDTPWGRIDGVLACSFCLPLDPSPPRRGPPRGSPRTDVRRSKEKKDGI